jgi:hypothetical protein
MKQMQQVQPRPAYIHKGQVWSENNMYRGKERRCASETPEKAEEGRTTGITLQ